MKTKLLTLTVLLISMVAFSQKKSRADRFFDNGDYLNAIESYEKQLNNGQYTKHVLENISSSYYNTFQFRKAYLSLLRLTSGKFYGKDKAYDNEFNFKMYQILSGLGEYDKALPYLEKYKKNNNTALDINDAKATIEAFKLKDDDFKIKLESSINSESAEFGTVKQGNTIYFTSDRKPNGFFDKNYKWTHRPFLNLYKVDVDSTNTPLSAITLFNPELNSNLHEGNFCFTKDKTTMYLSKSNKDKGRKKFDSIQKNAVHLYKSVKKDSVWSVPEKLTFNNVNYTIEHPALSVNESKLYFSSNMPGGYGDFDLYYVDINEDGTYGLPVNLGETINTENREQFPFISDQGHLYFSSNGHLGLGMMDVFVAKNENNEFEVPINLGAPINSSFDDFSFNYTDDKNGFFASNRDKKSDEIYSFIQIGEVFLRPYNARFEVRDMESKKYISNVNVSLIDADEKEIYNKKLDSISGFNLDVTPGKFSIKASSPLYKEKIKPLLVKEKENQIYVIFIQKNPIEEVVIKKEENEIVSTIPNNETTPVVVASPSRETIRKQLIEDPEGPKVVERNGRIFFELPPIYFDYDKWNIRNDSKKVLDDLALKLEKYQSVYIKISSHTDSRGTKSYNQLLSERRAESTRNYLALVGYINARRMEFEGFGESQFLIDCSGKICSEEEHQINRRSEFEIIKY